MTNDQIAALVAAAEDCTKPHGYLTAEYFQTLANPSAILSLVERLREAEEALSKLERQSLAYLERSEHYFSDGDFDADGCLAEVHADLSVVGLPKARAYMEKNNVK